MPITNTDAVLWYNVGESDCHSVNFFVGFRYLDLDESLAIYQTTGPIPAAAGLTVAGQPVPDGATVSLLDRFYTRNQFYGGQLGSRYEVRRGAAASASFQRPAKEQTATPRSIMASDAAVTAACAVEKSDGGRTSSGISVPLVAATPRITANPSARPIASTPRPNVTAPIPHPIPKRTTQATERAGTPR